MSSEGPIVRRHREEEHEEHIDERWLVSYADMMTLLFGLFVMLYAMQDPDAVKAMQKSVEERFGANVEAVQGVPVVTAPAPTEESPKIDPEVHSQLQVTLAKVEDELKAKNTEIVDLQSKIAAVAVEKEALLEKHKSEIASIIQKSDKSELLESLEKAKVEADKLKAEVQKVVQKAETQKRTIAAENKDAEVKQEELDKAKKEIDRLNAELAKKTDRINQGQFLAVVTSWTTADHDLDLVVTDPNGQSFNFKKRTVANAPGKLVVDSRRGPGAEVWQSDRIIPGRYKAEISFYNQYGNMSPAEVKLVIFASGGNIELPTFKMDFASSKKKNIEFLVDDKGKVNLSN